MDELEFRRRAYADPNNTDADFLAAKANSSSHQALVSQLQGFDEQLVNALQEPVPEHLAAALLRLPHDAPADAPANASQHKSRSLAGAS